MADTKDPAFAAWSQVQGYVDRLFGAAEKLDEAGGVERAADAAAWSSKTLARAMASIEDARVVLEELHERMQMIALADVPMPRRDVTAPDSEPARAPLARRITSTRSRASA